MAHAVGVRAGLGLELAQASVKPAFVHSTRASDRIEPFRPLRPVAQDTFQSPVVAFAGPDPITTLRQIAPALSDGLEGR
jgi:hypothetical protein